MLKPKKSPLPLIETIALVFTNKSNMIISQTFHIIFLKGHLLCSYDKKLQMLEIVGVPAY